MKRSIFSLAIACLLAGCVKFGDKPPPSLLTLKAADQIALNSQRAASTDNSIVVLPPVTSQMLATDRLAVRNSDTSIAYLADARWSEAPARLFADLLSETIAARTDRVVIDRRQYSLAPGARLTGRLDAFELDSARGEVVVIFDAALAVGDDKPLALRRFEARVKAPSERPAAVGRALNDAANQVAGAVADWIKVS
jgi:cholesterol transport system auxiliary component